MMKIEKWGQTLIVFMTIALVILLVLISKYGKERENSVESIDQVIKIDSSSVKDDLGEAAEKLKFKSFIDDTVNRVGNVFDKGVVDEATLVSGSRSEIEIQQINDLEYSKAMENAKMSRPWLRYLPIETNSYRIVYDYDKEMLRVRLLGNFDVLTKDKVKGEVIRKIGEITAGGVSYYFIEPN